MSNLVQIQEENHDIKLDLRYASTDNVCGVKMYKKPLCFLHIKAEEKLKKATKIAAKYNLKFKIFDGFRPLHIQKFMYEKFSGDFVSNPETGAIPHCRGVAVDLTLIDKNQKELEMGSIFDEFSELAFHNCQKITKKAQKNRELLLRIMTEAGWDHYSKEWWHYQLFNARSYPIEKNESI